MKVKKIFCIITIITMLIAMLPSMQAAAYVDSAVRFKRVTSADELVVGAKYLIVGYDADEGKYYALSDEASDYNTLYSGRRSAVPLQKNTDDTLSLAEDYNKSVYPLAVRPKTYQTVGRYALQTADNSLYYLSAFYSTVSTSYDFSDTRSKSLPIHMNSNGVSEWELKFRADETVLFKTTKEFKINQSISEKQSAYINFSTYSLETMSDIIQAWAFSGERIMTEDLSGDSIAVKTYLYKEVCAHDEANLTHTQAQPSTCSTYGNIEYYYCSNCCGYLDKNKTEIKLADTVKQLAPHENTVYVDEKTATCTEHGNIAYTKCEYCGKYFEGNSTDTQIDKDKVDIPAINHSYENGECVVCGAKVVTS